MAFQDLPRQGAGLSGSSPGDWSRRLAALPLLCKAASQRGRTARQRLASDKIRARKGRFVEAIAASAAFGGIARGIKWAIALERYI
jgi:hypothetical protein